MGQTDGDGRRKPRLNELVESRMGGTRTSGSGERVGETVAQRAATRPGSTHAWLTVHTNKTAVSDLMRIAWRSVGWICERVAVEAQAQRDLLSGLERIGFDEIAIRKGQRYLTVVVDRDAGELVWAHPGRDRKQREVP